MRDSGPKREAAVKVSAVLGGLICAISPSCAPPPPEPPVIEEVRVPDEAVIAHRGASYYAPEETRPAYLLARDLGATYLELDLQRTADGVLVAFHDDDLSRTTNVAAVFPGREKAPVSSFTWAELQQLDAGSWFNEEDGRLDRARKSFEGLRILALEDVIDIAESGDLRPGLYIETKLASQFPGIEKELAGLLTRRGWYPDSQGTPGISDSTGRIEEAGNRPPVILQTFERDSLALLRQHLPDAPAVFLLWLGEGYLPDDSEETYAEWIDFAAQQGAVGIGPDHENLIAPWAVEMIHAKGMFIHAYTVDDTEAFEVLSERGVDGFFTNRPDLCLQHYGRMPDGTVDEILERHGYPR